MEFNHIIKEEMSYTLSSERVLKGKEVSILGEAVHNYQNY